MNGYENFKLIICILVNQNRQKICFIPLKNFYVSITFFFNIILYWFKEYGIVMRQSDTLQSVPPNISTTHLAPSVVVTILLHFLCCTLCTHDQLVTTKCTSQSLDLFLSVPRPSSLLANTSTLSVSMSLLVFCLFVYFVLYLSCDSEHGIGVGKP